MRATGAGKAELPRRCGDLELFAGFDCSTGTEADLSSNELSACGRSGTLFVQTPSTASRALAYELQGALDGLRVVVVGSDVGQVLFDTPISSCSVDSCVRALLRGPKLGPTEKRTALLRKLSPDGSNANRDGLRKAARYLLHGQADHIDDVILRELGDTSLLQRLRIHEDLDGRLVSTTKDTYLNDDFLLDRAAFPGITVVAKREDHALAEKQRQLMPILDAATTIAIILKHEQPSPHWQLVLQALGELVSAGRLLEQSLEQGLKRTRWLPLGAGSAVAPQDVIHLAGLEDVIAQVVALSEGAFRDVLCLPGAVRNHAQFGLLVDRLFPDRADALEMLGEIMAEREEYRVGPLAKDDVDLAAFLAAFHDAPPHLMPCIPLVEGVAQKLSAAECVDSLIPALFSPISSKRIADILRHLAHIHARTGKCNRPLGSPPGQRWSGPSGLRPRCHHRHRTQASA